MSAELNVEQDDFEQGAEVAAKLKFGERVAYGLGDFGSNMVWQMVTVFLLFFYTDVLVISAAAVSILLLFTRIWDVCIDPFIGLLADRTRSKRGNYRPYLLFGTAPFAIAFILVFSVPALSVTGKIIYATVTYLVLVTLYSLVNVPYNAMLPVLTQNPQERANLAAFKFIGTMVATIIVGGGAASLVALFPTPQLGYQVVAAIFAVIMALALWLCYAFTKERYSVKNEKKLSLRDMFAVLGANTPAIIIMVALLFLFTGFAIRNATTVYYFKYLLGQEALAGAALALMALCGIVSGIITPQVVKILDKRNTVLVGLGLFTLSSLIWYFAADNLAITLAAYACGGFGIIMSSIAIFSMVADTIEYADWKTGIRAPGTTSSLSIVVTKFATAIGGALVGLILTLVHYVPNVAQTAESLAGIRNMVTLLPAVGGVIAIVVAYFYRLDRATFEDIVARLQIRDNS